MVVTHLYPAERGDSLWVTFSLRKVLMKFLNSTRVKAPNINITGDETRTDDSSSLNPSGRDGDDTLEPDTSPKKENRKHQKNLKLFRARREALIGTFNIRTVRKEEKRLELVDRFLHSKVEVMSIQEHRIVHEEEIAIETYEEGVRFITISAWRSSSQAATGGVGVMVTKRAYMKPSQKSNESIEELWLSPLKETLGLSLSMSTALLKQQKSRKLKTSMKP